MFSCYDSLHVTSIQLESSVKDIEEEIDIDLNDPEVEKAAIKIQAGFKGFMARKEQKEEKGVGVGELQESLRHVCVTFCVLSQCNH